MKIDIKGKLSEKTEKTVNSLGIPEEPKSPVRERPKEASPSRQPEPQIDVVELKKQMTNEILESIKNDEEQKKKKRLKEIEDREKELERVEKELQEEKENISKEKKYGRKSKIIPKTSLEDNSDYYTNYQIKVRNQKLKKGIFSIVFYVVVAILLVCNVYYLFLKQDPTIAETAAGVKTTLNITNFNSDGVPKYLEDNFKNLISSNVKLAGSTGTTTWDLQSISIKKVSAINDSYANVFFSASVTTNTSSVEHNYLISLKWDNASKSYSPASDLITRSTYDEDSYKLDTEDDIIWGFGEDAVKYGSNDIKPLTTFLEQFYTVLYNNKTDPGSAYVITKDKEYNFDNQNATFTYIDSVEWYQTTNFMGCNCKVTYALTSSEGLIYTTTSYLAIYKDGSSFKITSIY